MDDSDGPELVIIDRDGVPRPGLRPFDSERAREAGRKGTIAREAKRAAARASAHDVVGAVRILADTVTRDELAPMAFATAAFVMGQLMRGDIRVRNGEEAAALLRALVDIGRIESGDAQRTVAVAHLSGPALAARLRELQRSSAVQAADDVRGVDSPATDGGE